MAPERRGDHAGERRHREDEPDPVGRETAIAQQQDEERDERRARRADDRVQAPQIGVATPARGGADLGRRHGHQHPSAPARRRGPSGS